MCPRHAAALALVGWYLMTPPTTEGLNPVCSGVPSIYNSVAAFIFGKSNADQIKACYGQATFMGLRRKAPLSEWYQEDEFETLADCRKEQSNLNKQPNGLVKYNVEIHLAGSTTGSRLLEHDLREVQAQAALDSRCVASDDPRLKEK